MRGLNTFKHTNYINCLKKGLKTTHNIRSIVVSMVVSGKYVNLSVSSFLASNSNFNADLYEEKWIMSAEKYTKYLDYINNLYDFDFQEKYFKDTNKLKEYYKKNNYPYEVVCNNVSEIDKYNYVPFKTKCICGKELEQKKLMSHFTHKCKINTIKNEMKSILKEYRDFIGRFDKTLFEYRSSDFSEINIENMNKLNKYKKSLENYHNLIFSHKQSFNFLQNDYTKKDLNTAVASFKKNYWFNYDVKKYDYALLLDTLLDCERFICKVKIYINNEIDRKIKIIKENCSTFVIDCECMVCLDMKKCREVICCNKPICEDCEKGIKQIHTQSQNCPYCRNRNW